MGVVLLLLLLFKKERKHLLILVNRFLQKNGVRRVRSTIEPEGLQACFREASSRHAQRASGWASLLLVRVCPDFSYFGGLPATKI